MAHDFKLHEETSGLPIQRKKTPRGIIGLLIKSGIVKTEGQANGLMVLIVVVGISAIIYINLKTFGA
jgi:hypothetical protein